MKSGENYVPRVRARAKNLHERAGLATPRELANYLAGAGPEFWRRTWLLEVTLAACLGCVLAAVGPVAPAADVGIFFIFFLEKRRRCRYLFHGEAEVYD